MTAPRFDIRGTKLKGLKIIQRSLLEDHRGYFSRLFCADAFKEAGFTPPVSQINHTCTKRIGTVRGLHFQHPPHAEIKVVSCLKGRVFDVAVDLRKGSDTFLQWEGVILSEENHLSLLIPQGFAHGFQSLEENCELLYLHSESYCPEAEDGLNPADPKLRLSWPLAITDLSTRDQARPYLLPSFQGILL